MTKMETLCKLLLMCLNQIRNLFFLFLMFGCVNKGNVENFYPKSEQINKLPVSKITISYNDTICLKEFYGDKIRMKKFVKEEEGLFEIRARMTEIANFFEKEKILTMSIKDTSFVYKGSPDYPDVSGILLFMRDCKYQICKVNNLSHKTEIMSLVDSTYKEIFYYNSDYRIWKIEYVFNNKKFTYFKK